MGMQDCLGIEGTENDVVLGCGLGSAINKDDPIPETVEIPKVRENKSRISLKPKLPKP